MSRPDKPKCRMGIRLRRDPDAEWDYRKSEYSTHKRDPDDPNRCVRCHSPMRWNYAAYQRHRERTLTNR